MSFGISARYALARFAANLRPRKQPSDAPPQRAPGEPGLSVVIPSRNGRELLAAQLPGIARELEGFASEIIVVDNGSRDGTAQWLAGEWLAVQVIESAEPLSFARAVNLGIERARYRHICLLNNDMLLDAGFFGALGEAFDRVPDLFCATAQIRFPEGMRREETGKAVMAQDTPDAFPIRCDVPVPGEDLTYVLYGSGGCSIYDATKLRALGNIDEAYEPAYVEDLDIGYRAWQRGWPSVYVAGAVVEHRHRATTSRYYTNEELDTIVELNYLKFLGRAVADSGLFKALWRQAVDRLRLLADGNVAQRRALAAAATIALQPGPAATPAMSEASFLALTDGSVAVFPGHPPTGMPRVVVLAPLIGKKPRRAVPDMDQVVVAFAATLATPPPELLAVCTEVVLVRKREKLSRPSAAYRAALRQTVKKWGPEQARIESRDLQQYVRECGAAKIILTK